MDPLVPRYGGGSLADVVPSLLAGLGVPGMVDVLGISGSSRVCVLLVDGLGWRLLREYSSDAPFLASLVGSPITAGFPSTTASSLAALGTGLPTGEHGLVGYSFEDGAEVLNALRWTRYGVPEHVDLRSVLVPEEVQPRRTAFEAASDAGVAVRLVLPREQKDSGLSRAALRGGRFQAVLGFGDLVARVAEAMRSEDRVLCYAYHGDLDALGHVYGTGSDPWRWQLRFVDRLAAALADGLPHGGALVVTADHGMVPADDRVDFDTDAGLQDGVRVLGGEPRIRHVYTSDADGVRGRWTERLGDRAWVASRAEAVAAGWFGPRVADYVLPRIGDLVVAAKGSLALVRSTVEPNATTFVGHHGSLTEEEQHIPVLVAT
ncbi:putative AlkP superfamily pyrophosphatase or phosphodiesterase [Saccharothrix ecbatanensis]|uniref:Putative AlkP superfamily pyrophosphatase or phosphodiesterase n=1 Tax=Saccharothrix ecbatanensis TaxID=1105145 RepID=A0A7W9HG49_9PSEU|nr:nucleotide pyrophosphatase/phosphodiesterase family protein [Saccharothrix ecbatanensis]MBB5801637.1 putative AlkP superfamily pyrophosphatase or phosphodiesterase [Saccharothrix ecbatanensis]